MHRFEILSHTPPPSDEHEHEMAQDAACASPVPSNVDGLNEQDQESDPAKEFICEIEFIKSRVITLSSCDELYKERSRDIHYKSCGQTDCNYTGEPTSSETMKKTAAASSEPQVGTPKTRRFRRISLPHWLHKSSKKFSREEQRGRWATGSRKRRMMMRANSAPKTLGVDGRNAGDKPKLTSEEFRLTTEKLDKAQLEGKADRSTAKARVIRRISLPAHVSLNTGMPLGSEERLVSAEKPPRKYTMPSLRMTENGAELEILRRSILRSSVTAALDGPSAIRQLKEGLVEKQVENERPSNRTCSFSAVQEIISESRNLENVKQKRLIVSPKLQRFKKPDMFYIPLPDDGDEDNNSAEKIAHVMCRARRIEPSSNQHQEAIHEIMEYQLQSYLRQRVFMARCSQQWCLDLSQAIKVRVQNLREGYKVVCVVYIAAVRGQGLHAAVECTWSPKDDNFVVASYKNRSLFAIASVLVLKYN